MQKLHQFEDCAVSRVFQIRFAGIKQHVAQGHDQTTVSLRGRQADDLFFQPLALLLNTQQLGFAQGQLQALALQFELGRALLIEHFLRVLTGNLAITLAEVGVVHHIFATAPVAGQTVGAGQRFTGANHVFRRNAQDVAVFFDRLEIAVGLLQGLLAAVMPGATGQADAA